MQMLTIVNLLEGMLSNYWGDISPSGFGTPDSRSPRHKQDSDGYAFMQLLRKTQSQFTRLDQQQIFLRQIFGFKISSW